MYIREKFSYMQNMKKIAFVLFLLSLASCVSRKKIVYFQNDEINQAKVSNSYKTIFKPDDLLQITISSQDLEAVKPFNLPVVAYSVATDRAIGNPIQQSYLVDNNGEIDFPVLGKLKIGGLTRGQAIKMLTDKLDPNYVKNPTINIRINNYKITVLGDVNRPGTYTVPNERITILDAIGLAGDLKITAKRNDIIVQREEDGKKVMYKVDLLSKSIFTSPVYYLQQNDIVYIEPNRAASQDATYNRNTGLIVSIASVIITLISVLTR